MRKAPRSLLLKICDWHNPYIGWTIAFLLAGFALLIRLPGYSGRPLWLDEMWRAATILDPRFLYSYFHVSTVGVAITSPLYAILVKSVAVLWVSPETLRLSSLFPGVLAVTLAFAFIRKTGGSYELAALAGMVFVLNENFIGYSKEMKPYMFEVFVHLGCLYAWFVIVTAQRPSGRSWIVFYATMLAAILSTPTVIFLLPAFGISLMWRYGADRDIESLKKIVLGFCGLAVVVVAMYVFVWRFGATGGMVATWADGFPAPGENYAVFAARESIAILKEAFHVVLVGPIAAIPTLIMAALFVVALVAGKLPERRTAWIILLFYFLFLLTVCSTNLMGIWPLGALRPNLFLYGHVIVFLFLLTARAPRSRLLARILLLCGALLLVWKLHPFSHQPHFSGQGSRAMYAHLRDLGPPTESSDLVMRDFSSQGMIGRTILAKCPRQKTLIVSNVFMIGAIAYYREYDSALHKSMAWLDGPCVKIMGSPETYSNPVQAKAVLEKVLPSASDTWFVYTHLGNVEKTSLRQTASRYGRIEASKNYQGAGYFRLAPPRP